MSSSSRPAPATTMLLVEDNPHDEALALRALGKAGLADRVVVTRDGAEALDYLFAEGAHGDRDPADLPAVVLLDLEMPKVGGLEVLTRLRSDPRTRTLPVVIFSSSDEPRDLAESYRLGANSYVRKPIEFAEITTAVAEVGRYWLQLNELPPSRRGKRR